MGDALSFGSSRTQGADRLSVWVALFLATLAVVTRLQIFGDALADSDEGFYLLVGERLLRGAVLYVDIWDRKPAGLFLLYAGMRSLGGDGVVAYQIVGTVVAFLTAWLVASLARKFTNTFGAVAAGSAYLLWLPLGSAAGGQAELFCNLPVTVAAMVTLGRPERLEQDRVWLGGVIAMLLVGVAMQIKYTALFAGVFFGCCWLRIAWRTGSKVATLALGALWILAALTPTLIVAAWYAMHGYFDAFVYANFMSALQRSQPAFVDRVRDLTVLVLIMAPLLFCIRPPTKIDGCAERAYRFTSGWLSAAAIGLIAFGTYFQQFLLPLLMPASAAAAPTLGRIPRWLAISLLCVILVAGQCGLQIARVVHGSSREAENIIRRVDPHRCLYIYSGLAAIYRMSDACLATKYSFPSHLSRLRESTAIGVDPVQEVERIMETKPGTVIVRSPYDGENWAARAVILRHLGVSYRLVLQEQLGQRVVSVYNLRETRPDHGN